MTKKQLRGFSLSCYPDVAEQLEIGLQFRITGIQKTQSKRGYFIVVCQEVDTGGRPKA
jgi:hypothetical protein